jgi:hypothetical protein
MALLRNVCLLELRRRMSAGRTFDLMIVFDFDGVNENLITTGKEFCELLSRAPNDWGAVFANQRQAYYDVWALRHSSWCPEDCWQQVHQYLQPQHHRIVQKLLLRRSSQAAVEQYVGRRQVRIAPGESPIEVESAFGGIGIYKTSLLGKAWYAGRDTAGREVCEHVAFNLGIRQAGAKLYVMPGLLNDAPVGHLAPGAGAPARLWDAGAK